MAFPPPRWTADQIVTPLLWAAVGASFGGLVHASAARWRTMRLAGRGSTRSGSGQNEETESQYKDIADALQAISVEINSDSAFLEKTEPLHEADFVLIGEFIQSYCYTDLNARRIIDTVRLAALGPEHQNAGRLPDAQVFEKLREAADSLESSDLKDGILKAVATIELHVIHRHDFAHWAVRRIKGRDVFIMWTYNQREAEKRDGKAVQPGELKFALVPRAPLVEQLQILEGHGGYLAKAAAHVHANSDTLKAEFDRRKAAERDEKYQAGIRRGYRKGERRRAERSIGS